MDEQTLKKLSNEYIKGLVILSKMKEEGARPHDYLKHSIRFFKFKEYANDLLKKYEIPVIYETVNSLPRRRWEDFDTPFTGPAKLHEAGVQYCISMGTGGASNHRNTPYEASKAASYGLSKNEALKSVTLYAAEILGIADKVGSLEKGKDATLMITDGDPLEITTQVEQVYIQGKKIDMSDRHKVLYDKYKEKYRQLGKIK